MNAQPEASHATHATLATLAQFVAAVRRRRVAYDLAIAGAAGAALVGVVASAAIAGSHEEMVARWLTGALVVALAIGAAAVAVATSLAARTPYWREAALIDLVESDHPACANLLVTAHQLAREPGRVKPYARARVLNDAARLAASIDLDKVLPRRIVRNIVGIATMAMVAAVLLLSYAVTRALPDARTRAASRASTAAEADAAARGAGGPGRGDNTAAPAVIHHVAIELLPPAYTGLAASTLRDPERLDLLDGSRVRVHVDATADEVGMELDGVGRQSAARDSVAAATSFTRELTPSQSGVLIISATTKNNAANAAARRLIAVSIISDHPPTVTLTSPGHDLLASNADGRVQFVASATDDYGLRSLTLHYTKVSGSGERFEFKEAELPLTITRTNARQWQGVAERSLRDLGLGADDTLVYYAAATDHRPGQERAVSDSYVIEIGKPNAAIVGGFAVPKDEDVFAISLNALIQKTERLHAKRASMQAAAFGEAAMGLAIEQRMVRSEFLFSMGTHGRVEDEEEEAENSNEIQEGRLKNRGQTELAEAVDFMTRAERALTAADTGEALKAQRAALAAVQRAQTRQRYFLRTVPTPSRIDPARRLTGNLSEAASSHHPAPTTPADARAATIRTLLADCARLGDTLGTSTAADLASSLAARMIALDPASVPLHAAAGSLLQVTALAAHGRADEARAMVQSAVAALTPLAQQATGPAAAPPRADDALDPSLRGAMVDALRHPGGSR